MDVFGDFLADWRGEMSTMTMVIESFELLVRVNDLFRI